MTREQEKEYGIAKNKICGAVERHRRYFVLFIYLPLCFLPGSILFMSGNKFAASIPCFPCVSYSVSILLFGRLVTRVKRKLFKIKEDKMLALQRKWQLRNQAS